MTPVGGVDESPLALAERALEHVSGEAQVTVTVEQSLVSRFARSRPTQATQVDDRTVEILCVIDGHTGAATTNRTDEDALRDAALRAAGAAQAAASSGPGSYPGLPQPATPRGHEGFDPITARLEPDTAAANLKAAFAVAAENGQEAFGIWTAGAVETAIASSTGLRVSDRVTDAFAKVICRDGQGRSGFASDAAVRAADIDVEAVARRAAQRVPREEPLDLPPGEYPVVLEAEAVGLLLEFLGWLGFNGLAHAEGRGALSGRLGTRVAAAAINLSDSPRFARTLPRAFDAEGVPKAPLPLIQDGVAHRVVHDNASAARAGGGAASTGHALAAGGSPDGPAPTNLVLIGGGAADEHELAAPIERGLYVTRLWYVNPVREQDALLTGMTRDGTYLIEDGHITRPVRDVRFTDSVLRILAAVEALGARQRLVTEGEFYGRRFATGVVCPPLRAGGLRVTGATTGA
ncbi:MAG: metallopeptidase TldD-related protein [Actinomycetota bacterium]|nr:metallopeptidase TldD-related protein [Actinomycetota bacterium]